MNLFFVRHTQSTANLQNLLGGRGDYPLSPQGKADARNIAIEFKTSLAENYPIDRIIASPLQRAQQTAHEFAQILGITEVQEEPLLIEQHMGIFTGMSYPELSEQASYVQDKTKRWNWESEGGGESYQQIASRVRSFFAALPSKVSPEENLLIVSHAVCMRLIWGYLNDMYPNYLENIPLNGEVWHVRNITPSTNKIITNYFFSGARSSYA